MTTLHWIKKLFSITIAELFSITITVKKLVKTKLKRESTVRLGKMAQHARLWALFMAKLKGQSQNASNMALGQLLGLQHIQKSVS